MMAGLVFADEPLSLSGANAHRPRSGAHLRFVPQDHVGNRFGGWNSYDKGLVAPFAMQLVPQKMVVMIPDYVLFPEGTYRQMAREVADATAWMFENIAAYGGDPARVYLSGLVSYDPRWLADTGHSTDEIRGWIGLSGVYDTAFLDRLAHHSHIVATKGKSYRTLKQKRCIAASH